MMTNVDIKLRTIETHDINKLFEWRNNPDIRSKSFNTAPILWAEHEKWFKAKINDPYTAIYMAYCGQNDIGSIRFENKGDAVKISVMLNPSFIGKGFGAEIIRSAVEKYVSERKVNKAIIAEIKKDNIASVKAFQKAGFKENYLTFEYMP